MPSALRCLLAAVGYLSYQHYKGATGASTLKKLGLGSAPQQPLSAGLPNLQQQQPGGDASSGQAYTGFAPQSSESAYATQPSSGMPSGQANYPSQGGTYPTGPPLQDYQSPPGGAVPSDSNPMTYQTMLDSLPSSGNAPGQGQAYNSVQYPSIETGGAAGQYPNPGGAPASVGIQPGTATGCCPFLSLTPVAILLCTICHPCAKACQYMLDSFCQGSI